MELSRKMQKASGFRSRESGGEDKSLNGESKNDFQSWSKCGYWFVTPGS